MSTTSHPGGTVTRHEVLPAIGETLGLLAIFIVAITGRDSFGDGVKLALTVLTVLVGGLGIAGGVLLARRSQTISRGRGVRLALAGYMVFIGLYSIVHVLS